MIRPAIILLAAFSALAAEPSTDDLLRLTNGELAGHFAGLSKDGILRWEREDGVAPMEFKTDKVRQVVLRGGTHVDPGKDASHISLTNGDRIPGRLSGLDSENITVETTMAGSLVIPRAAVGSISPNPFGGRLLYAGPFSPEGWEIFSPDGADPEVALQPTEPQVDKEAPEDRGEPDWHHSGSRWYYNSGSSALRLEAGMPEQAIFRFNIEWRDRPPVTVAFHADFKKPPEPEAADNEDEPAARRPSGQNFADVFGNAFVLSIRGNFVQLHRCGHTKDGDPFVDQIRSTSANVRFEDTGTASFELRSDRRKGIVSMFVNGEFAMQWDTGSGIEELPEDDEDNPARTRNPDGGGIGFQMQGGGSPIRISEIIIAQWNGMPDSARSLESGDQDIVLLSNGTDRFSGKVNAIRDGRVQLTGLYAELMIPLEEIAEIRFASNRLSKPEASRARELRIHFQPIGRITGLPGGSQDGRMQLDSALLGKTEIDLTSAVILEFQSGSSFLNYWDEDL